MKPNRSGEAGHCSHCGARRCYPSRSRTRLERLLRFAGARFRRCHECGFRSARLGPCSISGAALNRLAQRVSLTAAVTMAVLLILAVILWYGQIGAAPPPSVLLFGR